MGIETELKLHYDAAAMRRIRRHPLIQRLKLGRPLTRFQKSVYFDTQEFLLRDHQAVLRVRHIGRRRIQTLKTQGEWVGGSSIRHEWEWEINGDDPEMAPLRGSDLAFLFEDERLGHSLRPIFATEVNRTAYRLGNGGWEIELTLDEGRLVTEGRTEQISEVELELKNGDLGHLFDVALALHEALPTRLIAVSKGQRGYSLAEGRTPMPQKAMPPTVGPHFSAAEAFRAIARSCVVQLLMNQDCLGQTHEPEAIHQMRVAARRLRSAMNIFKGFLETPETSRIREDLRWLQAHLGPARDADVFIGEILSPLAGRFGGEPGYADLCTAFQSRRHEAFEAALAALDHPRFTAAMLRLSHWSECGDWMHSTVDGVRALLDRSARSLAEDVLARRHRKVRKGIRNVFRLDEAARHLVRIEVKKLRYSVEFFSSLFPDRKARKLSMTLGTLQDRLGLLNDIAVSRGILKQQAETAQRPQWLWVAGMIAGWHAARVPELLRQVCEDWDAYDRLPRFWETAD